MAVPVALAGFGLLVWLVELSFLVVLGFLVILGFLVVLDSCFSSFSSLAG